MKRREPKYTLKEFAEKEEVNYSSLKSAIHRLGIELEEKDSVNEYADGLLRYTCKRGSVYRYPLSYLEKKIGGIVKKKLKAEE